MKVLYIPATLLFFASLSTGTEDLSSMFNERPPDPSTSSFSSLQLETNDVEVTGDLLFDSLNQTDSSQQFNDSILLEEFNLQYSRRMAARTEAIVMAAAQRECSDQDSNCPAWAEGGYCYSNAGYMYVACQKSCEVCDQADYECADNHNSCGDWAGKGECDKNPSYMKVSCRKSCGVCDAVVGGGGGCSDDNQYCNDWARAGECARNPGYMKVGCKKACGLCNDGGDDGDDDDDDDNVIPDTGSDRSCVDRDQNCTRMAVAGYCSPRPGQEEKEDQEFMQINCRKSCGYCGRMPDHRLDQHSCARVTKIPANIVRKYGIDSRFYGKYTEAYGLPITASREVDDRALMRMCYTVRWQYASHKSARRAAHNNYVRFIIIGKNQRTTQMPEYRHMDPYYDERARGFGAHVTSACEECLLYFEKNKWRGMDLGAHEVAHNNHLSGFERGKPSLFREISNAFNTAMRAGKYYLSGRAMYARTDYREYFAEALDSYLGDTWSSVPPHNAPELARYDNAVYQTLRKAHPCNEISSWIYVHNDIDQVLSRQQRLKINYPKCELEPEVNIPKEKDLELPEEERNTVFTTSGEKCRFPFYYNGRTYTSCTAASQSGNWYRAKWCATSTRSGYWYDSATPSHQNHWGYCQKQGEVPKACKATKSGQPCIFPFVHRGVKHSTCQGLGWCATKTGAGGKVEEWSTCDPSCHSREENERQTYGYNSLSG